MLPNTHRVPTFARALRVLAPLFFLAVPFTASAPAQEERENAELREARRRLAVMHVAVQSFADADKEEWAQHMKKAARALEVAIEGRRDREAMEIREAAPNQGQVAELLGAAARLHAEWDHPDRAEMLKKLSEFYGQQWRRKKAQEESGEENSEIKEVRRRIEVMKAAVQAYAQTGRKQAAEAVEYAIQARRLAIEGKRDRAAELRERAPNRGQLFELLAKASKIETERGHAQRAQALADLADLYREQWIRRNPDARGQEQEERNAKEWSAGLRRRLGVIARASGTYDRAGWETNTAKLKGVVNYGERLLKAGLEGMEHVSDEGMIEHGELIELLQGAARLAGEQEGGRRLAPAYLELAEHYAAQIREERREEGEDDEEREEALRGQEESEENAGLRRRMEIVRWARAAYAEAEQGEQARLLERFLHVAELQLEGKQTEMAQAFEGLSMGLVIELLRGAASYYDGRFEDPKRAGSCRELAEYYAQRNQQGSDRRWGESGQQEREGDRAREEHLRALTEHVEHLMEEIRRVQAELAELRRR